MNLQQLILDYPWMALSVGTIAVGLLASSAGPTKKKKQTKITELVTAPPDKAHGIIFGRKGKKVVYSPTANEGCVGVFSATGTGKTSSIGIPTLRSWDGTSFTIDISGDICKNCPDMPNKLIFDPEDPESTPYNVFAPIDALESEGEKCEALAQLALLLIPEEATNDAARFYEAAGRKILTAALTAFYFQGLDFIEICDFVYRTPWQELFGQIDATGCTAGSQYLVGFNPDNAKENSSAHDVAASAVQLFSTNKKVHDSLRRPGEGEVAVEPRCIEDSNIFLIVDDPKLTLYSPLLSIITSQLMQYISNRQVTRESTNILLFLDEYASLRISAQMVLEALRKYRKRRCRLMILTQNLADLDLLYGHDTTKAILANLRFKVLLGGLGEVESQRYFADLIGYHEVKKTSVTKGTSSSHTVSDTKEYIIEPADLDRQGKDTAILLHPEGSGWMKLRKNYYFK